MPDWDGAAHGRRTFQMNLITYDNSERGKRCEELLRSAFLEADAPPDRNTVYLLPIPTVRLGRINGSGINAEEFFNSLGGCAVVGYGLEKIPRYA